MAKNKFGIQFDGFDELMAKYDGLEGDLKSVGTGCLIKARQMITPNLHANMAGHHLTGDTEASIQNRSTVKWSGTEASIDIGFDLKKGGMPSIFLMYGTPRMPKDKKLYNTIYGSGMRRKISEAQIDILRKAIQKKLGG